MGHRTVSKFSGHFLFRFSGSSLATRVLEEEVVEVVIAIGLSHVVSLLFTDLLDSKPLGPCLYDLPFFPGLLSDLLCCENVVFWRVLKRVGVF